MTHPWVMDNNYVKYYPNPIYQWKVTAWTLLATCAPWLWPVRYDLNGRKWKVMAWNGWIQILVMWPWIFDLGPRPWHALGVMDNNCMCEALSITNFTSETLLPVDTNFSYNSTVTLGIWPWDQHDTSLCGHISDHPNPREHKEQFSQKDFWTTRTGPQRNLTSPLYSLLRLLTFTIPTKISVLASG